MTNVRESFDEWSSRNLWWLVPIGSVVAILNLILMAANVIDLLT